MYPAKKEVSGATELEEALKEIRDLNKKLEVEKINKRQKVSKFFQHLVYQHQMQG